MKSLLGAVVLIALMSAGALSSDAMNGFDAPGTGPHHRQVDKLTGKKDGKAERRAEQADRSSERTPGSARAADRPEHPLGGPPGEEQRGSGEPPAWAGGPDQRSAEPPGFAAKPADHPARTHGRP